MRPMQRMMCIGFAGLAVAAVSSLAWAQGGRTPAGRAQPASNNGDVTYEFLDDPLNAGGLDPHGGIIKVHNRPVRLLLIRPRTQFITEMLKSVESL